MVRLIGEPRIGINEKERYIGGKFEQRYLEEGNGLL